MIRSRFCLTTTIALVLAAAVPLAYATPAAAAKKDTGTSVASGRVVDYAELEHEVGAEIAIETTLNTVRRGTLLKYTNPTLTMRLGPEAGSIELSVPRDMIRRITLVTPAAEAATQEQGSSSGKAN